ncbi:MAG: hypothetical protein PUI02_00005, partial [Christensenellaceae bacterium]|nr:hypothetical protein [Christensenellaceae bacterium]
MIELELTKGSLSRVLKVIALGFFILTRKVPPGKGANMKFTSILKEPFNTLDTVSKLSVTA